MLLLFGRELVPGSYMRIHVAGLPRAGGFFLLFETPGELDASERVAFLLNNAAPEET